MSQEVLIDYRALRDACVAYDAMVAARPLKPPARTFDAEAPARTSHYALLEDIRKGAYG